MLQMSLRAVAGLGPKGPSKELVDAIVAIKRRNPTWGCLDLGGAVGQGAITG